MTFYGLIDWDEVEVPTLIVGDTEEAVRATAARTLLAAEPSLLTPGFLDQHPAPDVADPIAVAEWLRALWAETASPWFALLDASKVVHAQQLPKDGPMNEITPADLPSVGPNEPHVAFVALECRTCGEHSDWMLDDHEGTHHEWEQAHAETTGHHTFYVWTITRNTAQVYMLPTTTPSARRRRTRVGRCSCVCNNGGFCGGCGHAGCGGRR